MKKGICVTDESSVGEESGSDDDTFGDDTDLVLEQLDELGFDFNELNELSSWSMWRWIEYVYVINVRYCEERDKLVDISDLI